MRIKLTVEYDGGPFCGWQSQINGTTVQGEIERAFFEQTGQKINLVGSGRTDAGVHALGQVAHFDTDCAIPPEKIAYAINTHLPESIRILKSELVGEDFHARFNAKKKTYIYKIYTGDISSPIRRNTAVFVRGTLDDEKMKEALAYIVGEHDFTCFMASGSPVKDAVRTVYSLDFEKDGNDYTFRITGNGFLYNMVRIIVGTLIYVGQGRISPNEVKNIIDSKDRTLAGITMPPQGLYLESVVY